MENKLQEAVAYFKSEQAYDVLFQAFRNKFESLGRVGGTIPTRLFSRDELIVISQFYGLGIEKIVKKGSLSMRKFEQQLEETRYNGLGLQQIIEAYFGKALISKKQVQLERKEKRIKTIHLLQQQYPVLDFWFEHLLLGKSDSNWIFRMIEENRTHFEGLVRHLESGFRKLPTSPERIPMFSQRITGDPHAFDVDQDLGKLWLHVLTVHATEKVESVRIPAQTEDINDLLKAYHLYRDDLLNFVTCAGILAKKDGHVHPVYEAAVNCKTVLNIPLREIIRLTSVYPAVGKDVWIVENSGVCSSILDIVPSAPILSTNGQFKLAALLMMDGLVASGCQLHYSGDFDPEGLGMAQRLLDRYPNHIHLWRMDVSAYYQSESTKEISTERLEKLHHITNPILLRVGEEMQRIKKAGYQEALVDELVKDIKDMIDRKKFE